MNARTSKSKAEDNGDRANNGRDGVVFFRRSSAAIPNERTRVSLTISSDLHDRWEGLAETLSIWGEKPNVRYLTKLLSPIEVRNDLAKWFNSRGIIDVIKQIIPVPMFKPEDMQFSKDEYADHLRRLSGLSLDAAAAAIELTLPAMTALGFVSKNIKYSHQVRYGFNRVTVEDIRLDVTVYQVMEAVKSVSLKTVDSTRRMSKSVFAEALGEAFRSIGLALYEIMDLSGVIDDIVVGVRSNIDPGAVTGGQAGAVPADWRNNRVVQELSQNLVFVREALVDLTGEERLSTDSFKLERFAPVVLSAIKSSERYQWIGKTEALRHISTRKIRNVKGRVMSVVVDRRVETTPVAQVVVVTEDVALKKSYSINATRDRTAEVVQAAYGAANFSTEIGAELISGLLNYSVQMGWNNPRGGYFVDALGDGPTMTDIAVMLATRVYVEIGPDGVAIRNVVQSDEVDEDKKRAAERRHADPVWWFVVPTTEQSMDVWSGQHLGTEIVTCDPVEAIMAHEEIKASDALPARPQMLSPAAFGTRVVDFDQQLLRPLEARYSFSINLFGVHVHGAFHPQDIGTLRASHKMSALVLPHFNQGVIRGLQRAYESANEIVAQMQKDDADRWITAEKPSEAFFSMIRHRAAKSLLQIAQKLSPAFRNEIHELMIEKAINSSQAKGDAALRMRSELAQVVFGAYADVIALHFFLYLQGMDMDVWGEIIKSDEMADVAAQVGTDRDFKVRL